MTVPRSHTADVSISTHHIAALIVLHGTITRRKYELHPLVVNVVNNYFRGN